MNVVGNTGTLESPVLVQYEFFSVSTRKFVVLSLFTFGLYEFYWCYKNWQGIRRSADEVLSPFWRAFFAPFWCFSLFGKVHAAAIGTGTVAAWHPSALAAAYLLLHVCWRLPDSWRLVSMATFLPMVPVVKTIAAMNSSAGVESRNDKFSAGNIAVVVVGALFLLLVVIGRYVAAEQGAE